MFFFLCFFVPLIQGNNEPEAVFSCYCPNDAHGLLDELAANQAIKPAFSVKGTRRLVEAFHEEKGDVLITFGKLNKKQRDQFKIKNSLETDEFPLAWVGFALTINKKNDWAGEMALEQIRRLWDPSAIPAWKDVHKEWPDEPAKRYYVPKDFDLFWDLLEIGKEKPRKDRLLPVDFPSVFNEDNDALSSTRKNTAGVTYIKLPTAPKGLLLCKIYNPQLKDYVPPERKRIMAGDYPLAKHVYVYINKATKNKQQITVFLRNAVKNFDVIERNGFLPINPE
jgi:ABC-type phosphate transport system substrate-binding protein